jgi:hypothetical protein
VEAHIVASKEKTRTDHFKSQDLHKKGARLVEFLPQCSTINAGVCCDTFKKLRRAIQNRRRGMLSRGVVMIHDNARQHTAATIQDLIVTFG